MTFHLIENNLNLGKMFFLLTRIFLNKVIFWGMDEKLRLAGYGPCAAS